MTIDKPYPPTKITFTDWDDLVDAIEARLGADAVGDLLMADTKVIKTGVANDDNFIIKVVDNDTSTVTKIAIIQGASNPWIAFGGTDELKVFEDGTATFGVTLTTGWDIGGVNIRALSGTFDSLTSGRVPFASTDGLLIDDADFVFAVDTLTVTKIAAHELTGDISAGGYDINNAGVISGEASAVSLTLRGYTANAQRDIKIQTVNAAGNAQVDRLLFGSDADQGSSLITLYEPTVIPSLKVSDLTDTRVTFAAASGELVDDADMTFSGDTLTVTKIAATSFTGTVDFTGQSVVNVGAAGNDFGATNTLVASTIASLTVSDLTSGRIPIAGASGLLADDSDLTFSGDTLTATKIIGGTHVQTDLIIEKTADSGVTIDGVLLKDGDVLAEGQVFGVKWNQNTDTWTQIDIDGNTITPSTADFNSHEVWGNITRVNLDSNGIINARFGDGDYASDGSNGEVMVEIPAFYVRGEQTTTNIYEWWIGRVPLTGFEIHPAFLQRDGRPKAFIYLGAYEASLMVGTGVHDDDTTLKLHTRSAEQPWTGGEIKALPYDSGSVEFTRGETITGAAGGATAVVVDWTLTGGGWGTADAAGTVYIKQQVAPNFGAEDLNGSVGGANMASATGVQVLVNLDIEEARTYGENHGAGWGQMNIWGLSAIKLLFVIEYGSMDSQTEIGRGVVDLPVGAGYAGLETAAAGVDGNLDAAGTGVGTGSDGDVPATYRFMENLWGNVRVFTDGINAVDAEYRIIFRGGTGGFTDPLVDYEVSSMAPITTDGYIKNIEWDRVMKYLFIASDTTGGAATYIPDQQLSHDGGETNILVVGGPWSLASNAGLGNLRFDSVDSYSARDFGARLEYLP